MERERERERGRGSGSDPLQFGVLGCLGLRVSGFDQMVKDPCPMHKISARPPSRARLESDRALAPLSRGGRSAQLAPPFWTRCVFAAASAAARRAGSGTAPDSPAAGSSAETSSFHARVLP